MGLAAWYDRHALPRLITAACSQRPIAHRRADLVPRARGRVFELGCGGGLNQALYDRNAVTALAGIDPHPGLLEAARARARSLGFEADMREGRGEAIPFADSTFDTVLCTFTLCSVADPKQVAGEMRRVLRPGGRLLFLEHGRAPDPRVVRWQERIEPVWKPLAGGCHLTRPIGATLRGAGFAVEPLGHEYLPRTPRPFGWMEWGIARKEGL